MAERTRSFLPVGREMLRREFRIGDVAVRTVHLVRESLDLPFCLGFLRSFLRYVDPEFLEFSQYLDDVFLQSAHLRFLYGHSVIDAVDGDRKIFVRDIRRLEVEIFDRIQSLPFLVLPFFPRIGYDEITRESLPLLHLVPVLPDEFHEVVFLFEMP